MSRWSGAFVREALKVAPDGEQPTEFSEISTDTRTLAPGALFVALRGERFDGHEHLAAAVAAGARAAVVQEGTPPVAQLTLYPVPDTLHALGDLAGAHRRRITGPVVAITGSNGKTSTKEMCAAVLRTRFATHATRANDNNLVGIPLTLLAAPSGTEALVIEAGANQRGEIPRARVIIDPTVTVVTSVTASHLEGFGSVDVILKEKLALANGVPLAIVGTDPPRLAKEARRRARRVLSAGLRGADRVPSRATLDPLGRPTLEVNGVTVQLPLLGLHQAGNAMLAWVLVQELGLDRAASGRALETVHIPGGRGELLQVGGLTILNDCYNANPASMRTTIATARAMRPGRRLVFVAGTMRELGPQAGALHAEVAQQLADLNPDLLAVVGEFVPALAPFAALFGERMISAPDAPTLGPLLTARLGGDELVILKASRGVALERIIPHLHGGRPL